MLRICLQILYDIRDILIPSSCYTRSDKNYWFNTVVLWCKDIHELIRVWFILVSAKNERLTSQTRKKTKTAMTHWNVNFGLVRLPILSWLCHTLLCTTCSATKHTFYVMFRLDDEHAVHPQSRSYFFRFRRLRTTIELKSFLCSFSIQLVREWESAFNF